MLGENSILNWLAGDDPNRVGTPQLHWANLPESWGVFVLIAAIVAIAFFVFWLYRREIDSCPQPVKILLAVFRFCVLMFLVVLFLRPSVTFKQVRLTKPTVVFLRDSSLSFNFKDQYREDQKAESLAALTGFAKDDLQNGTISRAEILDRMMNKDEQQLLRQMREKASIRVVDFTDVVSPLAMLPAFMEESESEGNQANDPDGNANSPDKTDTNATTQVAIPPLTANGRGSDIWQALREVLNDSNQLAAIVLASDGQHTGNEDPVDLAVRAKELNIPIMTLPIGDPARPTNIAVGDVYVRSTARPGEPFEIEAVVTSQDVSQGNVEVELVQQTISPRTGKVEEEKTVTKQNVNLPINGGRVRVDFGHSLQDPGTYMFVVKVPGVEGEVDQDDNVKISNQLNVIDEKVKVLLIAGAPMWDYRMIQPLLQRDENILLTCWLQTVEEGGTQQGNERIETLPRTIDELGQYNVIIMLDPNPDEFDSEWIDNLKLFCKRKAGGFLYMAGPKYTGDFVTLNDLRGIRDLLPVRFNSDDILESTQILAGINTRPGKMLIPAQNLDHPVMTFTPDKAANRDVWEQMPEIYWSFPTLAPKPIAQTLIERGDQVNAEGNTPMLVTGRYGAGSVMYMGFSGTWRWRRIGLQAQYFDRFWIQAVRFLMETRSLSGNRRGRIDTDRADYELGDKVTFLVQALDERFEPLAEPVLTATIRGDDSWSQPVELKPVPGEEGAYDGSFRIQKTGAFKVELKLPGTDEATLIDPVSFRVKPPSVESNALWLNEKALRDISDASGGSTYSLDQLDQLVQDIPRRVQKTDINSTPVPLWDLSQRIRFIAFLLPVLLLAAEWAMRKKFKLL